MRIERKSTLTPVSGCLSPGLLCVEVVDRKLNDLIALGEHIWSTPRSFLLMHSNGTAATTALPSTRVSTTPYASPITTAASSLPSSDRIVKKRERIYHHRQEVRDSIASRLPARSQATTHRRPHTAIARHLAPRTANRATYNRART